MHHLDEIFTDFQPLFVICWRDFFAAICVKTHKKIYIQRVVTQIIIIILLTILWHSIIISNILLFILILTIFLYTESIFKLSNPMNQDNSFIFRLISSQGSIRESGRYKGRLLMVREEKELIRDGLKD